VTRRWLKTVRQRIPAFFGPSPLRSDRPTLFEAHGSPGLFWLPLPPAQGWGEGRGATSDVRRQGSIGPRELGDAPHPRPLSQEARGERPARKPHRSAGEIVSVGQPTRGEGARRSLRSRVAIGKSTLTQGLDRSNETREQNRRSLVMLRFRELDWWVKTESGSTMEVENRRCHSKVWTVQRWTVTRMSGLLARTPKGGRGVGDR
jgi:hypothetical protein